MFTHIYFIFENFADSSNGNGGPREDVGGGRRRKWRLVAEVMDGHPATPLPRLPTL